MNEHTNPRNGPTNEGSKSGATRRPPADPGASTEAADHLSLLVHELGRMLDGSKRELGIACNALSPATGGETNAASDQIEAARAQIQAVQGTLERMSGIVGAAMKSRTIPIGSPLLGQGVAVSLGEAIDHAVDVVAPTAAEYGARISVEIEREAGLTNAGPLYSVVLNALMNGVESIARCTVAEREARGGQIVVRAALVEDMGMRWVQIEVSDDGHGLPAGADREWAFKHGFSIKAEGGGVGLSVARQLVHEAGGSVELLDREMVLDPSRPGALLRIRCPYRVQEAA
ncbi:MAG: HAMP domain-containing sensor histidine kinase [Phycisphaerales bacterium]